MGNTIKQQFLDSTATGRSLIVKKLLKNGYSHRRLSFAKRFVIPVPNLKKSFAGQPRRKREFYRFKMKIIKSERQIAKTRTFFRANCVAFCSIAMCNVFLDAMNRVFATIRFSEQKKFEFFLFFLIQTRQFFVSTKNVFVEQQIPTRDYRHQIHRDQSSVTIENWKTPTRQTGS